MRFRALFALAVLFAACSGSAAGTDDSVASLDDSTATTLAEATADPEAAAIAFTECMRENGVEMEDPTVDADGNVLPGGPTDLPDPEDGGQAQAGPGQLGEDLQAAFEECGDLLGGTAFGFTPEDQTELQDQLLALAQCLRDQGLDVADPDLSNPPGGGPQEGPQEGGPFGIDFQDPEVQAAMDQCQEFMPNFGGGPGGGGPGLNVAPEGDSTGPAGGSDQ
ncbi:MAG: hypothetical protein WD473_05685 [Acidimicrobiia bacterium]